MGLEKKDIEIIQEIFEKALKGAEERLRSETVSSGETLGGEMSSMEERLRSGIVSSGEILRGEMSSMEERLRSEIVSSGKTLRGEMSSIEERLRIEIAAYEGRMCQQIENLASMTQREFDRMGKRISELSDRLQLVERRIAQLETRFGMMEEDLRLYREKASHVASELEAFRRHYETAKRDDHRANEQLAKELQAIGLRVEKLEAAVFSK